MTSKAGGAIKKGLTNLGYVKNGNTYTLNPDGEPTATVKVNWKTIKGEYDPEFGEVVGGGYDATIVVIIPDDVYANKFAASAKVPTNGFTQMSRSGNTFTITSYGD